MPKRTIYANCAWEVVPVKLPVGEGQPPLDGKILRLIDNGEIIDFPLAPEDVDEMVTQLQAKPTDAPAVKDFQVVRAMPDALRRTPPRR